MSNYNSAVHIITWKVLHNISRDFEYYFEQGTNVDDVETFWSGFKIGNLHCSKNSETFLGVFGQLMCPVFTNNVLESNLAVKFRNITCEIQKLPSK